MKITRKELRKIIAEEYRAVIAEEMGVENINQFQELIDILGDEAFEALAGKIDKFREGNTEARLEMRDDKIRVSVFMPDPDDPDDMEWNGDEDFDKTPEGLIQALEYAKKRLFNSDPIWNGIEQVVRRYDQPYKKRQVEYFIQKNYHGETNQYWTVQAGDGDDEGFSVWVIGGGDKFEIRDIGGNAVMETNSPKDVPGMVNRYMSQSFGKLNESVNDWSSVYKDKREGIEQAVEIMASIDPDVEQQIEQSALKLALNGIRYGLKFTLDNAIGNMIKSTVSQYGAEGDATMVGSIRQGYEKDLAVPYQMVQDFNGTQEEIDAILEAIEDVEDKLRAMGTQHIGFYYTGQIAGYGLRFGEPFYDSQGDWRIPQAEWDTALEDAKKYFYVGAAIETIKNNQIGLPSDKLLKLAGIN